MVRKKRDKRTKKAKAYDKALEKAMQRERALAYDRALAKAIKAEKKRKRFKTLMDEVVKTWR